MVCNITLWSYLAHPITGLLSCSSMWQTQCTATTRRSQCKKALALCLLGACQGTRKWCCCMTLSTELAQERKSWLQVVYQVAKHSWGDNNPALLEVQVSVHIWQTVHSCPVCSFQCLKFLCLGSLHVMKPASHVSTSSAASITQQAVKQASVMTDLLRMNRSNPYTLTCFCLLTFRHLHTQLRCYAERQEWFPGLFYNCRSQLALQERRQVCSIPADR